MRQVAINAPFGCRSTTDNLPALVIPIYQVRVQPQFPLLSIYFTSLHPHSPLNNVKSTAFISVAAVSRPCVFASKKPTDKSGCCAILSPAPSLLAAHEYFSPPSNTTTL